MILLIIAKLQKIVNINNFVIIAVLTTFVPFVMYSTGRIHKDAMAFLKKLARHAHDVRNIPEATLLKYYINKYIIT